MVENEDGLLHSTKSTNRMDSLTARELDDIYAFAIELGKFAGRILLEAAQQRYGENAARD